MQTDTNIYIPSDSLMFADSLSNHQFNDNNQEFASFLNKESVELSNNTIQKDSNKDLLSIIFLIAFTILAISNFLFRKRFRDLFKAFWARNYSNQLIREGNIFKEQFGLSIFLNFLLVIPLFYAFSAFHFLPQIEQQLSFQLLSQLLLIVLSLWAFRLLFIKFTSVVFNTPKSSSEVTTQLFIFNMISAVSVLPFIAIYYYSEQYVFLYLAISIWSIIQIYRFIRLFVIGFSYAIFSGLHLFLYLCTLEIIPIVILLKILSKIYL